MASMGIDKSVFTFLRAIKKNNNRPWFNANKGKYLVAHQHMIDFAEQLMREMAKIDELVPMTGKQSLFRIYRDVRFSKDKSPYKTSMSGRMQRASKLRRGGMYFHIEPGNCFLAGGFWNPNKEDMKRIREELAYDGETLRKILRSRPVKRLFGTLRGEQLKTAPKGYPKDHPNIDLLRYKQLIFTRAFKDKGVQDPSFMKEAVKTYQAMHPFFNYMSDVLTTDANGVRIV